MITTSSVQPVHSTINNQLALSTAERMKVLRFAASFVWADLEVRDSERAFLGELARELQIENATLEVANLLSAPPNPEEIDPNDIVNPAVADTIRGAALRAIASDGVVEESEMKLFELLDDLLIKPS